MARSKLTLSVEPKINETAKSYARENNISVSELFRNFIKDVSQKKNPVLEKYKDLEISPDILALGGILKGKYADDVDYREAKYEYLKEKYNL
jgi:hypothetical protein